MYKSIKALKAKGAKKPLLIFALHIKMQTDRQVDVPKNENKSMLEKNSWRPAFVIFLRLSNWIVWPVLAALLIGRWLDDKYNTEPWLLLVSVGVSFVISMIGLSISAVREIKNQEKNNVKESRNKN